jgi:RimJ/RimL family protein N-acetyltransferase
MNGGSTPEDGGSIARQIAGLKTGGGESRFPRELAIRGQAVGAMRSIRFEDLRDDDLIARLGRWRNENCGFFFTQFEATMEGTQRWLRDILDSTDRALFLIYDESGRAIGQCGARNITAAGAECDAILRGERHGHAFLMTLAERVLVEWLFDTLRIRRLYAQVFADNVAAVRLFLGLGMTVTDWKWFERRVEGNRVRYVAAGEDAADRRKVAWLEMTNPLVEPQR